MQATRAATQAWREENARQGATVLELLLAWLPGAPEPQPALVGAFAARVETPIIKLAEDAAQVTLLVGTADAPAADVEVTLLDRASGEVISRATSDGEGRATFSEVPAGKYVVAIAGYDGPLKISPMD